MISSDPEELLDDTPLFALLQAPSVYTTDPSPLATTTTIINRKRARVDSMKSPEERAKFQRTKYILAKSGLLEIARKTGKLEKSNDKFQDELQELGSKIGELLQTVLNNPSYQTRPKQEPTSSYMINQIDTKPPADVLQPQQNPQQVQQQQNQLLTQGGSQIVQSRNLQHQNFIDDTMAASPKVSVIKQHSSAPQALPPGYLTDAL
eukprot:TRINITY_DN8488_c0_g1_i4.p1 TRINITY_DN8488_c0_g1~~TRINITY_DN8488_c0_g1_i4.p1  ORF type:complete len:218 (+),score=51.10 TRINITY_DN8488_c0_g1_i4:39-656(+)